MSAKRTRHVMLRLTDAEYAALAGAAPTGEELAAFARRTLLEALGKDSSPSLRTTAAFVVAALSPDIGFEEALSLYDQHAAPSAVAHDQPGR